MYKIDELTIGQLKELQRMIPGAGSVANEMQPYKIGTNYLIRTVTHIDIGKVVEVGPQEIVMVDASWIADTGRYHNALIEGELNEVEPYPDDEAVIVGRGAVIDACRWLHPLPRTQK